MSPKPDVKPKPLKTDVDAAYDRIEAAEAELDAAVAALLTLDSTLHLRRHMKVEAERYMAPDPEPEPVSSSTLA